MISRRAALGTGAAVVVVAGGSHLLGVDDDAARAVGIEPRSEPDPADTSLVRAARATQRRIVAALQPLSEDDDGRVVLDLARQQLDVLGAGSTDVPTDDSADPAVLLRRGAEQAREQCQQATAPALARVLASLSVGRSQLAAALTSGAAS